MIRTLLRALAFALLAIIGSGAGGLDDDQGIGGTGLTDRTHGFGTPYTYPTPVYSTLESNGRGIGGTGLQAETDGRGIGGTGIIGTITAFGSIWVNDLEVHYDEDQAVGIFDEIGSASDLRVGQVVEVVADEKAGRLQARDIGIRHAVAGPIWAIDSGAGTMSLLGQQVLLPTDDPLVGTLRPGDRVAVSGLRDDQGQIIASRLDSVPKYIPAFVRGTVEGSKRGQLNLGGTTFDLPPDIDQADLETGRDLVLYGDPDGNGLRIRHLQQEAWLPFDGRVNELVVEGVVSSSGRRIGPLSLPNPLTGARAGERVLVRGRVGADRRLEPTSIRLERIIRRRSESPSSSPRDAARRQPTAGTRATLRKETTSMRSGRRSSPTEPRRRLRPEKAPHIPPRMPPLGKPIPVRPLSHPGRLESWH